jgi:hypothetical protein
MNDHEPSSILQWESDERFLQDENATQVPESGGGDTVATMSPAPSPSSLSTIAPTPTDSGGAAAEFSPVDSPTGGGGSDLFSPTTSGPETIAPDSNWTLPPNPTSWETESPGWAPTPTSSSGYKPTSSSSSSSSSFISNNPFLGFLIIVVVAIVGIVCGYKFCKVWQARRERHMLRLQSTRVDAVLGDMQMVSRNDEYDDDDPELL